MNQEVSAVEAVVLVSFGVSMPEVRTLSIDSLHARIKQAYPQLEHRLAFTSERIRAKLSKMGLECPPNVSQCLEDLLTQGIRRVLLLPTHVMPGFEYDKLCAQAKAYQDDLEELIIAEPLLYRASDYAKLCELVCNEYPISAGERVLFMGHGTEHPMNAAYPALQCELEYQGKQGYYVATVEGYPNFDEVLSYMMRKEGYTKISDLAAQLSITLVPLLFVAGEHACKDMMGDNPDSWSFKLGALGVRWQAHKRGLAEIEGVQELYLEHIQRALEGAQEE